MNSVFFAVEVSCLDYCGEDSCLSLIVPLVDPVNGADVPEDFEEVLARLGVLALHLLTTVEVDIILPTVSGLILVGKSWVERSKEKV